MKIFAKQKFSFSRLGTYYKFRYGIFIFYTSVTTISNSWPRADYPLIFCKSCLHLSCRKRLVLLLLSFCWQVCNDQLPNSAECLVIDVISYLSSFLYKITASVQGPLNLGSTFLQGFSVLLFERKKTNRIETCVFVNIYLSVSRNTLCFIPLIVYIYTVFVH